MERLKTAKEAAIVFNPFIQNSSVLSQNTSVCVFDKHLWRFLEGSPDSSCAVQSLGHALAWAHGPNGVLRLSSFDRDS